MRGSEKSTFYAFCRYRNKTKSNLGHGCEFCLGIVIQNRLFGLPHRNAAYKKSNPTRNFRYIKIY